MGALMSVYLTYCVHFIDIEPISKFFQVKHYHTRSTDPKILSLNEKQKEGT